MCLFCDSTSLSLSNRSLNYLASRCHFQFGRVRQFLLFGQKDNFDEITAPDAHSRVQKKTADDVHNKNQGGKKFRWGKYLYPFFLLGIYIYIFILCWRKAPSYGFGPCLARFVTQSRCNKYFYKSGAMLLFLVLFFLVTLTGILFFGGRKENICNQTKQNLNQQNKDEKKTENSQYRLRDFVGTERRLSGIGGKVRRPFVLLNHI